MYVVCMDAIRTTRRVASVVTRAIGTLVAATTMTATVVTMAGSQASPVSASARFERAVNLFRNASSMRIRFDQTLMNPLTGSSVASHGELLRKKPNLVSINFTEPSGDRIVSDGKFVWVYLPSSAPGQVIKVPTKASEVSMADPLGQLLMSSTDRYTLANAGSATIGTYPTHAVTMTPKRDAKVPFTAATVWIDDDEALIRQIETTEPSGVVRRIVLTRYSPNVSFSRDAFTFTPPPKMRVIDHM